MATLRLGDTAPDFTQDSSIGPISFHQWLGDSWGVFFSQDHEVLNEKFPKGYKAVKPYLRYTPQPNK